MAILSLALKSLLNRKLTFFITLFSIAISVALLLGVQTLKTETNNSFMKSISGTDLIIGSRGASSQLLLSSVFHIGSTTNTIQYDTFKKISSSPAVDWAVPISLGDSHRGYTVMATDLSFFDHFSFANKQHLKVQSGEIDGDMFAVVIGAEVAKKLNYKIGDEVIVTHGGGEIEGHHHDNIPFYISAILAPSFTAIDQTLVISLEAMEAMHTDNHGHFGALPGEKILPHEEHDEHEHHNEATHEEHDEHEHHDEVTHEDHDEHEHHDEATHAEHDEHEHHDEATHDEHDEHEHHNEATHEDHDKHEHHDEATHEDHDQHEHHDEATHEGHDEHEHHDEVTHEDHDEHEHHDEATHADHDKHEHHDEATHEDHDQHEHHDEATHEEHDEHDHEAHNGHAETQDQRVARLLKIKPEKINAIFVGLTSPQAVLGMQSYVNNYPEEPLSAIIPALALQELWAFFSLAEVALNIVTVFVVLVGLLGMLSIILMSLNERRREMAILRSVGARPGHIFGLIIGEAGFVCFAGITLGVALLYLLLVILQSPLASYYGFYLDINMLTSNDLLILAIIQLSALLIALIPGWLIYKYSLSDGMSIKF
ncbi:ABC transporter permease [uncultured Psychromonas sp.]|uniref:ABC transporter permease n=1 Tax=uncultured Psychromonas sp. TaxID=173974 RepID=UPI00260DCF64|nr:ABC transporter permease [uncultured Psychromonas sp.]